MKKLLSLYCAVMTVVILFAGCGTQQQITSDAQLQFRGPQNGDTIAVFETNKGTFKAVLYRDQAPLAVDNFIALAQSGYYDGLLFHRVIANFVIQSGDPTGIGNGGESASGTPFRNEYSGQLHHYTGALGMANAAVDENKSQFYVVQGNTVSQNLLDQMQQAGYDQAVIDAYQEHGGLPTLDNRYTVFGQVYEGLNVVSSISKVKTDHNDRPAKDVKLIRVTIEQYQAAETKTSDTQPEE